MFDNPHDSSDDIHWHMEYWCCLKPMVVHDLDRSLSDMTLLHYKKVGRENHY